MPSHYDLIVIGGGPAGSSAAITAARAGASVLLLERGCFPRHKVCGEFISAESLTLLAWLLGGSYHELFHGSLPLNEARLFIDERTVLVPLDSAAASITRYDLDFALWKSAQSVGVAALSETTVQSTTYENPPSVHTSAGDFSARAVVNASGRWSNLAYRENMNGSRWLGMKAHFSGSMHPGTDLYFFGGGYCGAQPLRGPAGEPLINVCALFHAGVAPNWQELFSRHPLLSQRSRHWEPIFSPLSTFPVICRDPRPVSGGIVNVGDAAGFVDPFVGDGIALALRGGHLASCSLMPFFRGKKSFAAALDTYNSAYRRGLAPVYRASSLFRKLLRLPRPLRAPLLYACQSSPRLARLLLEATRSQLPKKLEELSEEDRSAHDQNFADVVARQEKLDRREIPEQVFDVPVVKDSLQP